MIFDNNTPVAYSGDECPFSDAHPAPLLFSRCHVALALDINLKS